MKLNTKWILWYHSIKDSSWKKSSYTKFFTFSNLIDYSIFEETVQTNHLQNGMFLMREGIFPNWEDPDNSDDVVYHLKYQDKLLKKNFVKYYYIV